MGEERRVQMGSGHCVGSMKRRRSGWIGLVQYGVDPPMVVVG